MASATYGRTRLADGGRTVILPPQALILRFRVELLETDPLVWRLIDLVGDGVCWDLHVAIQDAMGWLDYHLHQFTIARPSGKAPLIFGVHDLRHDGDDPPGWATQVASVLTLRTPTAHYDYDFGDGWRHQVTLVEVRRCDVAATYPRCVDGARACPPEDCGGVAAFADIVAGRVDHEIRDWLPAGYDSARFDSGAVRFDDPARRLAHAFYGERSAGA